MFYLQNYDRFEEVARLRSPADDLEVLAKTPGLATTGSYATVDGRLVCLFRAEESLWLRIDRALFRIESDTRAEWRPGELRLTQNGAVLVSLQYTPPVIRGDDTPFVEDEDYDYLLLVANVLTEPGRRDRFFS